ncbi:hypothetical protein CL634_09395 [bacterium]|nr:hypothetical protein [bacterium]
MVSSATKGAEFEREICKKLSMWVSKGKRDDVFWRSAMSGGRATIGLREGKNRDAQSGDISSIHAMGNKFTDHTYVEMKFYKDLQLHLLITQQTGNLYSFWNTVLIESRAFKKDPWLVAKQNRQPILLCTKFLNNKSIRDLVIAQFPVMDLQIYRLDDYLKRTRFNG